MMTSLTPPHKAMQYLPYIDNLKGFAILLVVIGHVIQYLTDPYDFEHHIVFRYIYSFHMPLFFMISGMMVKESYTKEQAWQTIRKRFLQLIAPFTLWTIIWSLTFLPHPFYFAYLDPNLGPWFLWCLFCIIAIDLLVQLLLNVLQLHQHKHSITLYIIVSLVICLALRYIASSSHGIFGLTSISFHYIFYVIGVLLSRYRNTLTDSKYAFGGGVICAV